MAPLMPRNKTNGNLKYGNNNSNSSRHDEHIRLVNNNNNSSSIVETYEIPGYDK